MGAMLVFLIVLAAIAVLALVFIVGQYNALVVLRTRFNFRPLGQISIRGRESPVFAYAVEA